MIRTRELKGLIPVVQTPMNEDGSLDLDGQARLIEFLHDKNVGGYWVLGTGSEDMNLSFEKRVAAAQASAQIRRRRGRPTSPPHPMFSRVAPC